MPCRRSPGIPLAWVTSFIVTAIPAYLADRFLEPRIAMMIAAPMYAIWLPPLQRNSVWLIPAALAVLCFPCFLASVWLERKVMRALLPNVSTSNVRACVWRANLLSYGVIVISLIVNAVVVYQGAARRSFASVRQHRMSVTRCSMAFIDFARKP